MPTPWGPYTLTPGTPVQVNIGLEVASIQVHNESPYILYISFGDAKPTAPDATTGAYDGYASPWAHPVLVVQRPAASPRERILNAIRDFHGSIWIMPQLPPQARVIAGNPTQYTYAAVEAFTTEDTPPQPWAVARETIEISQQRVIDVPISGGIGSLLQSPVNVADYQIKVVPLSAANIASLSAAGGGQVVGYVYYFDAVVQLPAASTTGSVVFYELWADLLTAGGATVASTRVFYGDASAFFDNTSGLTDAFNAQDTFAPATPGHVSLQGSFPTATQWQWRLHVTAVSGTPGIRLRHILEIDQFNSFVAGAIGNQISSGVF